LCAVAFTPVTADRYVIAKGYHIPEDVTVRFRPIALFDSAIRY